MLPADQGLEALHPGADELDDRLEVQHEGVVGQALVQIGAQPHPAQRVGMHPGLVAAPSAVGAFRAGQGDVGLARQLRGIGRVKRGGDADGRLGRHDAAAGRATDDEGCLELAGDPPGEVLEVDRRRCDTEDTELVGAEPGDTVHPHRRRRSRLLLRAHLEQPPAERAEQRVTDLLPHGVVDGAEPVDVDQQHPDRGPVRLAVAAPGDRLLHRVVEPQAVAETGQRVDVGPVDEFLLQPAPFSHVVQREHPARHRRFVGQVAHAHLDVRFAAVAPVGTDQVHGFDAGRRRSFQQLAEGPAGHVGETEQLSGRGTGVGDGVLGVDDKDDVGGVEHERAEVRLVVAPGDLLAQVDVLHHAGRLPGQHTDRFLQLHQRPLVGGDIQGTELVAADRQGASQRELEAVQLRGELRR